MVDRKDCGEESRNELKVLTEEQNLVTTIMTMREGLREKRDLITPLRNIHKTRIMEELRKINNIMGNVPIDNITELNDTFYVSAVLVISSGGSECVEGNQSGESG